MAAAVSQLQSSLVALTSLLGTGGSGPAPIAAFAAPSAPAATTLPPIQFSGATPNEIALVEQLLQRASASPTAQRLFADLRQTGMGIVIKDDALDPKFASEPETGAYAFGGVMYLRRSELANAVTGDRLMNTILHEAIHIADYLMPSRIMPAVGELDRLVGRPTDPDRIKAEKSGVFESRAYGAAHQIMVELGRAPARSGGFAQTGVPLAQVATELLSDPLYSRGATRTAAQSMSDAVLGHALLPGT